MGTPIKNTIKMMAEHAEKTHLAIEKVTKSTDLMSNYLFKIQEDIHKFGYYDHDDFKATFRKVKANVKNDDSCLSRDELVKFMSRTQRITFKCLDFLQLWVESGPDMLALTEVVKMFASELTVSWDEIKNTRNSNSNSNSNHAAAEEPMSSAAVEEPMSSAAAEEPMSSNRDGENAHPANSNMPRTMTKEKAREEINKILERANIDIDSAQIELKLNSWRGWMVTSPVAIILAAASGEHAHRSSVEKEAQGIFEYVGAQDVPPEERLSMLFTRIKRGVENRKAIKKRLASH